jgi:hypothetical protein
MLSYPVYISAQHEDGRRELSDVWVTAASPDDAIEKALQQFLPRFGGEEGWRIGAVVNELQAIDPNEDVGKSM